MTFDEKYGLVEMEPVQITEELLVEMARQMFCGSGSRVLQQTVRPPKRHKKRLKHIQATRK